MKQFKEFINESKQSPFLTMEDVYTVIAATGGSRANTAQFDKKVIAGIEQYLTSTHKAESKVQANRTVDIDSISFNKSGRHAVKVKFINYTVKGPNGVEEKVLKNQTINVWVK